MAILTISLLSHPTSRSGRRRQVDTERAARLLAWFDSNRRPLPWRRDRDPYRIWVAEVMLQQTRVAQAVPFYERFLATFPNLRSLAASDLETVRKAWEGAGYYQRAEHLWRAAGRVVRDRDGVLPTTAEEWRTLPGVGPYIAAAVASLAHEEPVVALDANAIRVAARWTGERGDPRTAAVRARLHRALSEMLPHERPGAFNEAIMELGETICRPRGPDCPACPVRTGCVGGAPGADPERYPGRTPSPRRPVHRAAIVVLEREGRWLVQRRAEGGLLAGLWEFPGGHLDPGETALAAARRELREETGWAAGPLEELGTVRHAYSHFAVTLQVFRGPPRGRGPSEARATVRWVTPEEFEALPRPMATRKVAALVSSTPPARASPGSGPRTGPTSASRPAAPRSRARPIAIRRGPPSSPRSRARR